jgi:hypothetical protein
MSQRRSLILSALVIAAFHFMFSLLLAFTLFVSAWGSSLSDSYQTSSPFSEALTLLLLILQAPVALTQWLIIKNHPQTHTGLEMQYLILLGASWSAALGWLISILRRKIERRKN